MGILSRFEYANEAALKATIDYEKLKSTPNVPISDWLPRFETLAEFGRANSYGKFFTYFNGPNPVKLVEAVGKLAKPDINVKSNARLYFSVDQGNFHELFCLEFVLDQGKFNAIKVWSKSLSGNFRPTDEEYQTTFLGYSPLEGGVTDVSNIMDDFRNKRGQFAEFEDTEKSKTEESEEEKEDEDGKEKERKKAKISVNSDGVDKDDEKEQESEAEEYDEDDDENSPAYHNVDFNVAFLDFILKHDKHSHTSDWKKMSLKEYSNKCGGDRDMAEQILRSGLAGQYLKLMGIM